MRYICLNLFLVLFALFAPKNAMAVCLEPEAVVGAITQTREGILTCTPEGWVKIKTQTLSQSHPQVKGRVTENCSAPGDICPNGSVYIDTVTMGIKERIYITGSDLSGEYPWNNGIHSDRGSPLLKCKIALKDDISSCRLGRASSNLLAQVAPPRGPYIAAKLCVDLVAHGKDDWYLPAIDELILVHAHSEKLLNFKNAVYWSSTEFDDTKSWAVNWALPYPDPKSIIVHEQTNKAKVRCIRRERVFE